MLERLALVAAIAVAFLALRVVLAWHVSRVSRRSAADLLHVGPLGSPSRRQLILAFSTPECVPCQTAQKPALEELVRRFSSRVEVRHINASDSSHLARRFGIFTVPSTVVVDADGSILAVNHGLSGWEKLAAQLQLNGPPVEAKVGVENDR